MPKSPEEMAAAMKLNIEEKTGKPLAKWLKILKASKLEKHGQLRNHLKDEHGVTHGFAGMIASEFLQGDAPLPSGGDLVATQYAGGKAELKPIYDKLIKAIEKFGKDIEVAPKKAYVSLRRSKQFALIQPSTKTRLDVGLVLKGEEPGERLEASGSFNAMVSHRVRLASVKDVDKQLIDWLKEAYKRA